MTAYVTKKRNEKKINEKLLANNPEVKEVLCTLRRRSC